jgi:hypothetical protein
MHVLEAVTGTTADELRFVSGALPGLVGKLRRLSRTAAGLR